MSRHLREPEYRYRDFLLGIMAPAVLVIAAACALLTGLFLLV